MAVENGDGVVRHSYVRPSDDDLTQTALTQEFIPQGTVKDLFQTNPEANTKRDKGGQIGDTEGEFDVDSGSDTGVEVSDDEAMVNSRRRSDVEMLSIFESKRRASMKRDNSLEMAQSRDDAVVPITIDRITAKQLADVVSGSSSERWGPRFLIQVP